MNLFAGIIGHIGDGNFHGIILHDKDDLDERKRVEKCVHNMVERALDMDGTCTVSRSKIELRHPASLQIVTDVFRENMELA